MHNSTPREEPVWRKHHATDDDASASVENGVDKKTGKSMSWKSTKFGSTAAVTGKEMDSEKGLSWDSWLQQLGGKEQPKHGGRSTFTPPFLCECRWLINLEFALASLVNETTHHNATAVRRTIGQSCIAATATPRWWATAKQYGSARAKHRCGACVQTKPRPAVNDLLEWRLVFEGIKCALTAHCDGSEGVWVGGAVDSCRSTMQCMRVFMARVADV